jgi:MFS family permease
VTVRLHHWRDSAVPAAGALTLAVGFAEAGATTTLGDVARAFGEVSPAGSVAATVGLSGTTLGIGLAAIRLASVAGLPLAALADRAGRRPVLLGCVAAGLGVTALAALSPGYWWFVALLAAARPRVGNDCRPLQALAATHRTALLPATRHRPGRRHPDGSSPRSWPGWS